MTLVDEFGAFCLQLDFIKRLLAISQALDVLEVLLLDDLELLDYFGVFKVDIRVLSHDFHLLCRF